MKEIQFSIELNASKEIVWTTLWDDLTFRDSANIIDEGTYMKGVLKEGNEIQFISSVNPVWFIDDNPTIYLVN